MQKKVNKLIFWIPHILAILFILFLTLFSLDVFSMNLGFWQSIGAFFMHSIPSIILTISLIISWKYEIVGGIFFGLAGLYYIFVMLMNLTRSSFRWFDLTNMFIILIPIMLISILFFIGWFKKRK